MFSKDVELKLGHLRTHIQGTGKDLILEPPLLVLHREIKIILFCTIMVDRPLLPSDLVPHFNNLITGEQFLAMASPHSDSEDVVPLLIEQGKNFNFSI